MFYSIMYVYEHGCRFIMMVPSSNNVVQVCSLSSHDKFVPTCKNTPVNNTVQAVQLNHHSKNKLCVFTCVLQGFEMFSEKNQYMQFVRHFRVQISTPKHLHIFSCNNIASAQYCTCFYLIKA